MKIKKTAQKGFTLIEILVVVALIAILAAVVVFALNPAQRFKQARDTTRRNDVNAVANAVALYLTDGGTLTNLGIDAATMDCTTGTPATLGTGGLNLAEDTTASPATPRLVSKYLQKIPQDPTNGTPANTGYTICLNTANDTVSVSANSEVNAGQKITATK